MCFVYILGYEATYVTGGDKLIQIVPKFQLTRCCDSLSPASSVWYRQIGRVGIS